MKLKNKKAGFVSLGWIIMALIAVPSVFSSGDDAPEAAESSYSVTVSSQSQAETQKKNAAAKKRAEQEAAAKESREEAAHIQESQEAEAKRKAEEEEAARLKAEQEAAAKAQEVEAARESAQAAAPSVPAGETYAVVNNNIPYFTNEDLSLTKGAWEAYGDLDHLGRVTAANAMLSVELMPAEERGDISDVYPTGWQQAEYATVSGGWLYNRSHLIGHQLTGEDANWGNLMTGTRWFNTEGMLPFENFVANYIETTENHVRYRVTPHFEGDNLLASGVFMEGFSIEDNGEGLTFNIYVPNIQPGVALDYATGTSWLENPPIVEEPLYEEPAYEEPVYEEPTADVFYQNCTAVRAAGAAPIYEGDPGWDTKFDRDGDGVGCEP